ncbi:MAG: hypothetical protein SGILL_010184, partial [Bacillariaceae sp.]
MPTTTLKRSATTAVLFVFLRFLGEAHAFVPNGNRLGVLPRAVPLFRSVETTGASSQPSRTTTQNRPTLYVTTDDVQEQEDDSNGLSLHFNPLYGALWLGFLVFGIFLSPGEVLDLKDTQIIEGFINDPSNTAGGMNPLFFAVFNGLGIMPIVMAQLALPQGSKSGVPAAPFMLGSVAAGFGAAGLYLTLRAPPVERKTKAEASWITSNILDNKIANWGAVALSGSVLVTSGILSSFVDGSFSTILDGYMQLASTSKLVCVSSVDLMILSIAVATLIPQDYRLRTADGGDGADGTNIPVIAASTLLLPVVGAAL